MQTESRYVTRQQIITDIGRRAYEKAVNFKKITPIKFASNSANSKVRVNRYEYEKYLQELS